MAKKAVTPVKKTAAKPAPVKGKPAKKAPPGAPAAVDLDAVLAEADDAWGASREKEPSTGGGSWVNENVVDGDYYAQLTLAKVGVFKKSGTPYMQLKFKIVRGELSGETVTASTTIDNETIGNSGRTHLDIISSNLQNLGVDTKKIESTRKFPEVCAFLTDKKKNKNAFPYVTITVKNQYQPQDDGNTRHYQNVFVNSPVSEDELPEE